MKVAEIKNGRKYKDRQRKSSYIKKDDAQFYMIEGKAELVYFCKANQKLAGKSRWSKYLPDLIQGKDPEPQEKGPI